MRIILLLFILIYVFIGCSLFTGPENSNPKAKIKVSPPAGNPRTTFVFDASESSDKESTAEELQFRWDWENDGEWDTPFSNATTITHRFPEFRTYTVKLEVKDSDNKTGSVTVQVEIDSIVMDIDGNRYRYIRIGSQEWTVENLKTSRYRNGSPITNVLNDSVWANTGDGGYRFYFDDPAFGDEYGYLYNWYAVKHPNGLTPSGWRIPTTTDWQRLFQTLGGESVAGNKLKSKTNHWTYYNPAHTNASGFTALPGGYVFRDGQFGGIGLGAYFWSSTALGTTDGWYLGLYYDEAGAYMGIFDKHCGFSVRMVRDVSN
ncbi:MAG: hypothetical protein Kow00108_10730 [Calditrichia bacterium]